MEKRHFYRNRCLQAAVAAVALTGLASKASAAGLAFSLTTHTADASLGTSTQTIATSGVTTLDVWATVTGAAANANAELLQSFNINITSGTGAAKGALDQAALTSAFKANGAQDSSTTAALTANVNLDGDSDLDLGSTNSAAATGWLLGRSASPFANGGGGAFSAAVTDGFRVKVGTVRFTSDGTSGTTAFTVGTRTTAPGALWFEDSTQIVASTGGSPPGGPEWSNDKNPTVGSFTGVANFTLTVGATGTPNLWGVDANGNYNVGGSWNDTNVPAQGAVVTFGGVITAPRTVTVDAGRSIGGALFSNTAAYTLSSGTLSLNNTAGATTLTVTAGSHTINTPVTLGANTGIDVAGGSNLTIANLTSTGFTVTKTSAGNATVDKLRNAGTTVSGGALIVASNGGAAGASKVTSLTASTGKLDLKDNDIVVDSGGVTGVRNQIMAGAGTFTAGVPNWDGTSGITTSGPASANGRSVRLGYAAGNDANLGTGIGPSGLLSGQAFTASAATGLVKYTYQGDADLDGDVDGNDVGKWALNFTGELGLGFGTLSPTKVWTQGDWDYDGDVDGNDVGKWALNFTGELGGGGIALSPGLGGASAVPEPASLGLIIVAGSCLGRRRRK